MPKVFICYRRTDSASQSDHIHKKLADQYGEDSVVFDVDSIPKGVNDVDFLNE